LAHRVNSEKFPVCCSSVYVALCSCWLSGGRKKMRCKWLHVSLFNDFFATQ